MDTGVEKVRHQVAVTPDKAMSSMDPEDCKFMAPALPASLTLSDHHQCIIPIAAFASAGELAGLRRALERGLDEGLPVNTLKEVLVQVYAYAGFPRSLNALAELMAMVEARKTRGIQDVEGQLPSRPVPVGEQLLAAGTANQTRLVGGPVKGPLFDFAPVAGEFLRTHLFGDIFERDNLDWQSRELATIAMLSAIQGAEAQLQAHMGFSMNIGVTESQLHQLISVLAEHVGEGESMRARNALARCRA